MTVQLTAVTRTVRVHNFAVADVIVQVGSTEFLEQVLTVMMALRHEDSCSREPTAYGKGPGLADAQIGDGPRDQESGPSRQATYQRCLQGAPHHVDPREAGFDRAEHGQCQQGDDHRDP